MKRFEKHVFICENQRPPDHPKGCCYSKGSAEITELFKRRLKELGLNSSVRANKAGCLDACSFGAAVVVYPEQIWYGNVTTDDVEEIIQEHIIGNRPVERLKISSPAYNKDA